MVPVAVRVDFGTTNSVVAIADRSGQVQVRRFDTQVGTVEAYRSALLFFREGRPPNTTLGHISGPDALLRAMDIDADHRFLQSLKTHLSSATLRDIYLLGRRFLLEELIGVFLKDILPPGIGDLPVVCGRPVVFAGERPNEARAIERLTNAYRSAGVTHVDFAYEPLGAAYWYARTIRRQETVLVADFGGGTSDFSVMRFDLGGARMKAEALSQAGVGVAGDTFDFRIVDNLVSPRLGKGASYRSFGKRLPLPSHYYAAFAQWHRLSLLKDARTLGGLRQLVRQAEKPQEIEDLMHLIEADLGYELYQAISKTKLQLSAADEMKSRPLCATGGRGRAESLFFAITPSSLDETAIAGVVPCRLHTVPKTPIPGRPSARRTRARSARLDPCATGPRLAGPILFSCPISR